MLSEAITQEQIHLTFDGIEPVLSGYGANAAAAIGVITLAFSTDPIARWVYPDPHEYLTHFPEFIRAFAGKAFERSTAYLSPRAKGAALWLGPGVEPDEDPLIGLFWSTTSDEVQKDLFPMFEKMGEFHPKEPHWYLPMIGVEPGHQGMGIGASLMQHALSTCDSDRLPAYLESSNPKNIPLYERFGFETIGIIQEGNAPPMYPMYRRAR
ncbi:MAG: GNAT family N-acetyltransferase [Pyrinomonadaceae bacterium]